MEEFIQSHPVLRSRFPNIIEFPDYSSKELMKIAELEYTMRNFILRESAKNKMHTIFETAVNTVNFGNGRYIRNIVERSINNQAYRLISDPNLTKEELLTIEAEDIKDV